MEQYVVLEFQNSYETNQKCIFVKDNLQDTSVTIHIAWLGTCKHKFEGFWSRICET